METSNGAPKPRKMGVRRKQDRVCQAIGYRTALIELIADVKDAALREEMMKRGEWADSQIIEYGGMYFTGFRDAANERIEAAETSDA